MRARVILEPNESDHRGHSYTIQVTKTKRLIMHNTKNIYPIMISTGQYLWQQIEKATIQFEDVFMQAAKVSGLPNPWVSVYRIEVPQGKTQAHEERGEAMVVHTLFDRRCSTIYDVKGAIPLPSCRLPHLAICVTESQTALPVLMR